MFAGAMFCIIFVFLTVVDKPALQVAFCMASSPFLSSFLPWPRLAAFL